MGRRVGGRRVSGLPSLFCGLGLLRAGLGHGSLSLVGRTLRDRAVAVKGLNGRGWRGGPDPASLRSIIWGFLAWGCESEDRGLLGSLWGQRVMTVTGWGRGSTRFGHPGSWRGGRAHHLCAPASHTLRARRNDGPAGGAQHPRAGQSGARRPGAVRSSLANSRALSAGMLHSHPGTPAQHLRVRDPQVEGEEEVVGARGLLLSRESCSTKLVPE